MPSTFVVVAPTNKSVAQKANEATEFVGRVGCNLILGWLLFKAVAVIVILGGLWLLFWLVRQ